MARTEYPYKNGKEMGRNRRPITTGPAKPARPAPLSQSNMTPRVANASHAETVAAASNETRRRTKRWWEVGAPAVPLLPADALCAAADRLRPMPCPATATWYDGSTGMGSEDGVPPGPSSSNASSGDGVRGADAPADGDSGSGAGGAGGAVSATGAGPEVDSGAAGADGWDVPPPPANDPKCACVCVAPVAGGCAIAAEVGPPAVAAVPLNADDGADDTGAAGTADDDDAPPESSDDVAGPTAV